jgi:2-polyprenyl-6-methoxyphenol hydroxylase-like FAD-dependent oxidoreductase
MRIAVAGGGPGGLFFATLMRRVDSSAASATRPLADRLARRCGLDATAIWE